MSNFQIIYSAPGAGSVTSAAISVSATTTAIAMLVQRFDGGSGTTLVSSGVPLKPGVMFDTDITARKGAVFVAGVEKACFVKRLYGRFPDGSRRGVLVQFNQAIPNATAIAGCEFRPAQVRTTTDIAETVVTYANAVSSASFLHADSQYLCDTECTLQPLVPASLGDANMVQRDTKALAQFHWAEDYTLPSNLFYPAAYDFPCGAIAQYCRTLNTRYLRFAITKGIQSLKGYYLANDSWVNAEGITGSSQSPMYGSQEQWTQMTLSAACVYLMTGWETAWRMVNLERAAAFNNKADNTTAAALNTGGVGVMSSYLNQTWGTRFNVGKCGIAGAVLGYVMEATHPLAASGYANRNPAWVTEMPRLVDCLYNNRYSSADTRQNVTGIAMTNTDIDSNINLEGWEGPLYPTVANGCGSITNFQLSLVAHYLIMYFRYVYPDTRIITLLQGIATHIEHSTRLWQSGDQTGVSGEYVLTYYGRSVTANTGGGVVTMGMFSELYGFLYAHTGSSTYLTLQDRMIDQRHCDGFYENNVLKEWPEIWGYGIAGTYYRQVGATSRPSWAPSAIVAPASN